MKNTDEGHGARRKANSPNASSPVRAGTKFQCQECGHSFRSTAAAERASFGPEGCPNCGGADIDEAKPAGWDTSHLFPRNCTNPRGYDAGPAMPKAVA